jgi:hypothetical protein
MLHIAPTNLQLIHSRHPCPTSFRRFPNLPVEIEWISGKDREVIYKRKLVEVLINTTAYLAKHLFRTSARGLEEIPTLILFIEVN